jgi:predicted permease
VALGAKRVRILRQLLTESMVLALGGAVVAVPVSLWLSQVFAQVRPPLPIDMGLRIGPDWRVLLFTLATAIATGVLIGLIPALRASRPDLAATIKDAASWMGGKRRVELRDGLVVMQVAVSLVLVVGGALLVRSLAVAHKVDFGYDVDRLAQLSLALEMTGYDTERADRFFEAGRQRIQALPEVESVSLTSRIPLSLNNNGFAIVIDGHQASADDQRYNMDGAFVDERYAETFGLRLLSGRMISAQDRAEARKVVVVTRTVAERYWPGREAVGQRLRQRWGGDPYEIIGVVADYKVNTPGEEPQPYLHFPLGGRSTYGNFVVRTRVPAAALVTKLERELKGLDPDLVFLDRGTLRELADVRLFPVRAGAWLIGAFGLLALAVAAIGLYGVIGYSVSRRVREIGIRKALGAGSPQVIGMILREGMILVVIGGVIGAGLASAGARALSSVLFVGAFDILSFAMAFAALAAVAMLANAIPAWRAARVDPLIAIRSE